LALVTQEFRNDLPSAKVTIAAGPSISTLWLMPRLAAFRQEHPHLGVRIITTDVEADFFGDEVDVAIIYGRGPWRGYAADLLLEEEVFPVCSPGYRAAINLNSIGDFANATLIDLENEQWDCVNWRIWLAENGASHLVNARRLHINNYPLVIQAARDGHGVALGWRYLVDSLLQDGALVCPVGERLRTGLGYHVIVPAGSRASDEALLLREWILSARV
jgi:DNA-binding transcriptional LysR family regulator